MKMKQSTKILVDLGKYCKITSISQEISKYDIGAFIADKNLDLVGINQRSRAYYNREIKLLEEALECFIGRVDKLPFQDICSVFNCLDNEVLILPKDKRKFLELVAKKLKLSTKEDTRSMFI